MAERPYDVGRTDEGLVARVRVRGSSVLTSPMLNRGTAFTLAEREDMGLTGLLPEGVSTMEGLAPARLHHPGWARQSRAPGQPRSAR